MGEVEEMAEAIVEAFIKLGLDDEELFSLFRSPVYYTPHAIYQEKGEDYVRALIGKARDRWGFPRVSESHEPCISSNTGGRQGAGTSRRLDATVGRGACPPPSKEGGE
jgi:hypothetical protein